MGCVLKHMKLLSAEQERALAALLTPPVRNRVGLETGRIRPAADCPIC